MVGAAQERHSNALIPKLRKGKEMFRTLTHYAIVTLALILVMANTATAAPLINTYTPTAGNPASGPYDSNITTTRSSVLFNAADYESRKLVDGVSAKGPGDQTPQPGFTGTQPNFTDTDNDGFPDYGTDPEANWVSNFIVGGIGGGPNQPQPVNEQWVSFSFPSSEALDFMRVWNGNQTSGIDQGIEKAYLWYSTAGSLPAIAASVGGASPGAWTQVPGGLRTFAQANGLATYDGESMSLAGIDAKHLLIDIETNYGSTQSVQLSEFQFFAAVIPEPATLSLLGLGGLAMLRRRRA